MNYLSADPAVREHMEPAIDTVLNFTEEDLDKVKRVGSSFTLDVRQPIAQL